MKAYGPSNLLFALPALIGVQGSFGLLPRASVQQQSMHENRLTPSSESYFTIANIDVDSQFKKCIFCLKLDELTVFWKGNCRIEQRVIPVQS